MASNIIITFNSPAQAGDILQIQDSNTPTVLIDIQFETLALSLPVTNNIDFDITNVNNLLNNAYNVTNRYTIVTNYVSKTITITDNIGNSNFTEVQNSTFARLTTSITNEPIYTPVSLKEITLLENVASPCDLVDIQIETFDQVTEITSPIIQSVSTNPFTITGINRDTANSILISVNDGISSDTDSVYAPILNSSLFSVNISLTPTGGSVDFVLTTQNPDFNLEYSIDGVNYYSSSSFSGLSSGNYTAYVRDSIGCSISFPFEITAFEPNVYERLPYFEISQQNSLIAVKREDIDDITIFKNPLNTLSYEEETQINYRNFKQKLQKSDGIITQQYRSNYDDTTIKLHNCDGEVGVLLSTKKSENFDITDVRDVKLTTLDYLGSNFVGVQYGVGNTYNPDTLLVDGSYNLGTETPDFMNVDDYLQIEGAGWYKVRDVLYYNGLETLILDVLTISFPFEISGQTVKGTSVYNRLDYEIYEFDFDCSSLDGDYFITYDVTDSEFDSISYKTEWFNVSEKQLNTYLLQYYNSENNETNYSTGIVNKVRIPYLKTLTYLPNDTQEVYLTDTNAVNIDATYRDLYSLEATPIPMGFVRKIGLATSNDRLFLNGLSLLKNTELEVERIGVNNLYRITVQFIRSDYAFNNVSSDGSIVLPSGQPLNVNVNTSGLLFVN